MPNVPARAKTPTDREPKGAARVRPAEHPDGWELLRPTLDVEYWEQADVMAAAARVKTRGDQITLTATNLKVIGQLAKLLQEEFAVDSSAFREWVRSHGSFEDATGPLLTLAFAYVTELGEADSSAS